MIEPARVLRRLVSVVAAAFADQLDKTHSWVADVAHPKLDAQPVPYPAAVSETPQMITAFGSNPTPLTAWLPVEVFAENDPFLTESAN
jgi:hypothetical protein